MRAVVQRVKQAKVRVNGQTVGSIGSGLLAFVGIAKGDAQETARSLAEKIANLRVFDDEQKRLNRSLLDLHKPILCVSQFTLYGDCRRGRRPSYDRAAPPEVARVLYEVFVESFRTLGVTVETGQFQAPMEVELVNEGPVTLLLDSDKLF